MNISTKHYKWRSRVFGEGTKEAGWMELAEQWESSGERGVLARKMQGDLHYFF
jgi:hypothetical protein